MPEDGKFGDYIKAKEALKARLARAGIAEWEYLELLGLLEAVTGTDLETVRGEQFADDAYSLAVMIQCATGKKTQQISLHLRRFAEHVVRHAMSVEEPEKIKDIVDQLPQMVNESEEAS
jgi:hypothetical protein